MFLSELQFGLNDYSRQKVLNERDSIAQVLLNLLFMRPGQMPSMPHIGIDIKDLLYDFESDIDTANLKLRISNQCAEILPYVNVDGMTAIVVDYYGVPTLLLNIPIWVDSKQEALSIGIRRKNGGEISFNYMFQDLPVI